MFQVPELLTLQAIRLDVAKPVLVQTRRDQG